MTADRTVAIVVTFHPGDAARRLIERLTAQVSQVVVVDNTPATGGPALDLPGTVRVVPLHGNRGLAAALNVGVTVAREYDPCWICLFDQDSLPEPDYVPTMIRALTTHDGRAAGAGRLRHPGSSLSYDAASERDRGAPRSVDRLFLSGLTFPIAVLEGDPGFREEFLVDSVDYDFCLRLRHRGVTLLRVPAASMEHELGDTRLVTRFGRTFVTTNHPAWRYYYIFRNEAVLRREHRHSDPDTVRSLRRASARFALHILLGESQRPAKIGRILQGLLDARTGRRRLLGPFAPTITGGS